MSQNPERGTFADALHDAAAVFEAPDASSLHGAAVRRGRQIRRRRKGAAALMGGTVALGTAGVLAFALSAPGSHGTTVAVAGGKPSPTAASATPGPSFSRPAAPPAIGSGKITQSVVQGTLEYTLPADAQVLQELGGGPNVNIEVVDTGSHSWSAQTAISVKSSGESGTLVSITVIHTAGANTCAAPEVGHGAAVCTQSTVDGGRLLDNVVPPGSLSSTGAFEFFDWFSPTGYEVDLEIQDSSLDALALTKVQSEAVLTNQAFGVIAHALPADGCPDGSFSDPVDGSTPGSSALQKTRCSSDGKYYPTD